MPVEPQNTLRDGPRADLPEDYYLANSRALSRFVEHMRGELLAAHERDRTRAFRDRDEPAQRLCVRFPGRRGPAFRVARPRYVEIAGIDGAAAGLGNAGRIDTAPPATLTGHGIPCRVGDAGLVTTSTP